MHPCKSGPDGKPCGRVRITDGRAAPYVYGTDCALCYLFTTDARQNVAWGGTGEVAAAPPLATREPTPATGATPSEPCRHQGDEASRTDRERLQLGLLKSWRYCEHPDRPLGNLVCPCAGCGPACRGYELDREFGDPAPPVEALTPTSGGSRSAPTPATRRARVLLVGHSLERSGAPILLARLAKFLRGFDLVIHVPEDGPLRSEIEEAGIRVTIGALDLRGVDLVVANTIAAAHAIEAAERQSLPSVWMIHESDPAMCGNLDQVRRLIAYPAAVVFPCRATADAYRDWHADPVIIPTAIPPVPLRDRDEARTKLGIRDGEFAIVSLGRDEERKGQGDIWAAAARLSMSRVFCVADQADPWTYLAAADAYVCSSRLEAFPLAIQEAKAYGRPVITTPTFGAAEIIRDGVDGLHYQSGDVEDLRAKLAKIRAEGDRWAGPLTHLPSYAETLASYENVFHRAIGWSTPPRVVYHVAGMGGHWKSIVTEQLESLARAGLRQVLATHVGAEPDWLIDEAARLDLDLVLTYHDSRIQRFEAPAIRLVERLARQGHAPILYLHSKGVSHPLEDTLYHDWRRLMMRELVERWREHTPRLADYDAVGVNWWTGQPHYSGNFWLARPDWIRKLPPFDRYFRDRYSCERWIGSTPGCRAYSIGCTDKRFWDVDRPLLERLLATGSTR